MAPILESHGAPWYLPHMGRLLLVLVIGGGEGGRAQLWVQV